VARSWGDCDIADDTTLGRARVHSDLHSILIVTKARDNRLVKLTRELAIYIMQKRKPSVDGKERLVVYVDAQLQYSKRFDVEGIQREYPEFFHPVPRRYSSSSSLASGQSSSDLYSDQRREEGQLRYWTADMCSRSPHLFDFVVTVSPNS
jgi:NAD+ kinase